jgi:molybdopterin synthase catalytic subunit
MTMTADISFRVQADDFDLNAEVARVKQRSGDAGAIVTFTGICRDEGGRLVALELEHYPGMAEDEVERIAQEAASRWPVTAISVIHRTGRIPVGENIVLVVTASAHREAAFAAATFLMDFLKTDAPFWKKEHLAGGREGAWVASAERDRSAADRWRRR